MFKFLEGMRQLIWQFVCGISISVLVLSGCKSHDQGQGEGQEAKKKAVRQHDASQGANTTEGSAGPGMPNQTETIYSRNKVKTGSGEYETEDTRSDSPETYEGGDPGIYRPPVHKAQAHEKVVTTDEQKPTPTPTPSRPIDKPLDPTGRPAPSQSPGG